MSPTSACTARRPRCTWKTSGSSDITITTGLVDTSSTPKLIGLVNRHQLDPSPMITHRFSMDEFDTAYDVFGRAADTGALKVLLTK